MKIKKYLLVILLSFTATALKADLSDELMAYYPFNGNANDATGNGYDGVITAATFANDRFGNIDCALSFNGSTSDVEVPKVFSMQSEQTITVWINPTTSSGYQPILEKAIQGFGGEVDFQLRLPNNGNPNDGTVNWVVNTVQGTTGLFAAAVSNATIPTGQWTFLACVIDQANNQVLLYINGGLSGVGSMGGRAVRNSNWPFRIGRQIGQQQALSFNGGIDDVRVYNRALSSTEIDDLFKNRTPPNIVQQPQSQIQTVGGTANFSVIAEGAPPITYQWLYNGSPIAGATASTLPLVENNGNYQVQVSNDYGTVGSSTVQCIAFAQTANAPAFSALGNGTIPSNNNLEVFSQGIFVPGLALNPNAMTIVLTHGWNSNPNDWAANMASLIMNNIGNTMETPPNIVAWDWSNEAKSSWYDFYGVAKLTTGEGRALGQQLLAALGPNYSQPIHFYGHSLGTLVNSAAADYLHGDAPGVPPSKSPGTYLPSNTQLTLFDEAGIPADPENLKITLVYNYDLILADLGLQSSPTAPFYLNPIPKHYEWIDNYISAVGVIHPEAANVILTNLPAGAEEFYSATDFTSWWHAAEQFHDYPYLWYDSTIQNPNESLMGNQWSFERNTLSTPPIAGLIYRQTMQNSEFDLKRLLGTTGESFLLGRTAQEIEAVDPTGIISLVKDVIKVSGQVGGEIVNDDLQIVLQTIPVVVPLAITSHSRSLSDQSSNVSSNVPAFAWVPVLVPSNTIAMSFNFTVQGNANNDTLEFAINDTNILSLELSLIATNVQMASGTVNISQYAGQSPQMFFGVNGGTSSNLTLTINTIQFYNIPPPILSARTDGANIILSWPMSSTNYLAESSCNLGSANTWTIMSNTPSINNFQETVTNGMTTANQFYRLMQQ